MIESITQRMIKTTACRDFDRDEGYINILFLFR